MMVRTVIATVLALVALGGRASAANEADPPPPVALSVERPAADWLREFNRWNATFDTLRSADTDFMQRLAHATARTWSQCAHPTPRVNLEGSDAWIRERRSELIEIQKQAEAARAVKLSPPSAAALKDNSVRAAYTHLASVGETTARLVRAHAPLAEEVLANLPRAIRADAAACSLMKRRVLDLQMAMMDNNLNAFRASAPYLKALNPDHPQGSAVQAQVEFTEAQMEITQFGIDRLFGAGADAGVLAASLRRHADAMEALAYRMNGQRTTMVADARDDYGDSAMADRVVALMDTYDETFPVLIHAARELRLIANKLDYAVIDVSEILDMRVPFGEMNAKLNAAEVKRGRLMPQDE